MELLWIIGILAVIGLLTRFTQVKILPASYANFALIAAGLLFVGNWAGVVPDSFGGAGGLPGLPTASLACDTQTTPDLFVTQQNAYVAASAETSAMTLFLNGKKNSDTSSPFAVSPNDAYTILIAGNTSLYGAVLEGNAECKEVITAEQTVYPYVAPTFIMANDAGTADTAQAVASNEVKIVTQKITAASDGCFGNPNSPEGIVVGYSSVNTTEWSSYWDTVEVVGGTKVGCPQFNSTFEVCYQLPIASVCDGASYTFSTKLDSDNTNNPPATADIAATFMDTTAFLDPQTNKITWGYEDSNGADVGPTAGLAQTINIT